MSVTSIKLQIEVLVRKRDLIQLDPFTQKYPSSWWALDKKIKILMKQLVAQEKKASWNKFLAQ